MTDPSCYDFYVGSYSAPTPESGAPDGHGLGIAHASLDRVSGAMTLLGSVPADNPSFLTVTNDGHLWSISERPSPASLTSYRLDADNVPVQTGALATGAPWPCHVEVDTERHLAFISHYHGGALSLVALHDDGRPHRVLQVLESPENANSAGQHQISRPHYARRIGSDLLLVTDCGRDLVILYAVRGSGLSARLEMIDLLPLAPGTGPRHASVVEGSMIAYISTQTTPGILVVRIDVSPTVTRLVLLQTVGSPGLGRFRPFPSEIVAHPDGRSVYMANRRDDSMSAWGVEDDAGSLVPRQTLDVHGVWPRHFRLTPDGRFAVVANQNSNELATFRIDDRGDLDWTGQRLALPTPTCVVFR